MQNHLPPCPLIGHAPSEVGLSLTDEMHYGRLPSNLPVIHLPVATISLEISSLLHGMRGSLLRLAVKNNQNSFTS